MNRPGPAITLAVVAAAAVGYGVALLAGPTWYLGLLAALLAGWVISRFVPARPAEATAPTPPPEPERAELELRLTDTEVERDAARAELKAAELEIRRRKQLTAGRLEKSNRELREFAFAATHDLQEPLRKLRMFGDLLLEDEAERMSDVGKSHLGRMLQAADYFEGLLDDLLDLHRPEQIPKAERVDLTRLIDEALAEHADEIEASGAQISIGQLATIEADPGQLRRVFVHLIGNALKFGGDAPPRVEIEGRFLERPVDGTPCFALFITDHGIGFDRRYVNRIFQLFQRLHTADAYPGRGIGLTLCRRIVEAHDGAITAQSAVGEGSTFIVTLPIQRRITTLPPLPLGSDGLLPPIAHRPDSEMPSLVGPPPPSEPPESVPPA